MNQVVKIGVIQVKYFPGKKHFVFKFNSLDGILKQASGASPTDLNDLDDDDLEDENDKS